MSDPITRLNAALEGRYRIERELGEGGMAVWVGWAVRRPSLGSVATTKASQSLRMT